MDTYPIPYRTHELKPSRAFPSGTSTSFPLVTLTLSRNGREIPCPTVIDSGTHFSLFPFSVGRALGLKVENGKQAIVPPDELVYFWDLEVTLEGKLDFPLFAGFSKQQDERRIGLLGQIGFFDKFDISFEQAGACIVLTPRSPLVKLHPPS